jgi:hypothetical protein
MAHIEFVSTCDGVSDFFPVKSRAYPCPCFPVGQDFSVADRVPPQDQTKGASIIRATNDIFWTWGKLNQRGRNLERILGRLQRSRPSFSKAWLVETFG